MDFNFEDGTWNCTRRFQFNYNVTVVAFSDQYRNVDLLELKQLETVFCSDFSKNGSKIHPVHNYLLEFNSVIDTLQVYF